MSDISPNGARRIYRILCNLAASDGSVDPTERAALGDVAMALGLSPTDCGPLEVEGIQGKKLQVGKKPAEREALMRYMIEIAAADGVLAPQEHKRILQLGAAVGLVAIELEDRLAARFAAPSSSSQPAPASPSAAPAAPEHSGSAVSRVSARFPGYESAKRVEHGGLELRIVESTSDTKEYGRHEGGSPDRETTATQGYVLVGPSRGWALFRIRRTYLASDRFDKESVSLTCQLDSGETFPLGESLDYEKYNHAQDYDRRSPLAPLSGPLKGWGFPALEEEHLQSLVSWLMTFPS